MKNPIVLKRLSWCLWLAVLAIPLLSSCKSTDEHPKSEHPTQEHPTTNAPPAKP